MVNDSTWMDSETKKIAIDKVNAIREFLAYPDWIKNQTALESYYSGVCNIIFKIFYINIPANVVYYWITGNGWEEELFNGL